MRATENGKEKPDDENAMMLAKSAHESKAKIKRSTQYEVLSFVREMQNSSEATKPSWATSYELLDISYSVVN